MAIYNASSFLRECMDSVLSQTFSNFEFLIVDDGSDDDSVSIVESYKDSRIRLIKNQHNYINSLNILLSEAKGDYIARMDSDDVMMPNRLSLQFRYMEEHKDLDVLAGLTIDMPTDEVDYVSNEDIWGVRKLTYKDFLYSNPIAHPTTFIRKATIVSYNLRYKTEYKYVEDYVLWCDFILLGLNIAVMDRPVLKYRLSKEQITQKYTKQMTETANIAKAAFACNLCKKNNSNHVNHLRWSTTNKMTAIIPFLNEGEEVVNTVKSIRTYVKNDIDIIVINDQSTDEYPYKETLAPYNVHYVVNWQRKGVAASRDYGVSICKTPYFVLMDAHMRIYDSEWLVDVCKMLALDDRQILCMQTRQLWKNEQNQVVELNDVAPVYGAYLTLKKGKLSPGIEWNYAETSTEKQEEIPSILGAGYVASKNYWIRLKGLRGLEQYGSDEAYISLKAWLEGGKCILLKNHVFGHIYRDKSPYYVSHSNYVYNYLLIAYTLFPENMWAWVLASCQVASKNDAKVALTKLRQQARTIKALRSYYKDINQINFRKFWCMNQETAIKSCKEDRFRNGTLDLIYEQVRHTISDNGIVSGNMARWIWVSHFARKCKLGNKIDTNSYFYAISNAIRERFLPINFRYGLSGIGWGLIYMYKVGLLHDIDAWIFDAIDAQVACQNVREYDCNSFFYGFGGILAYIVSRIGYCITKGEHIPWNKTFLLECKHKAEKAINLHTDFSTLFYSHLYLIWYKDKTAIDWFDPYLSDWINVNQNMPSNMKYWKYDFDSGCLAYTIGLITYEPIYIY